MGFKMGIVGLPNVGKSTLFNALTKTAAAQAANFPFCTIEPNVGDVAVPDARLDLDANKVKYPPIGRVTRNEKEKIHKNYAVNDVSMALWAKARSLEEIGKINLAKNAYSKCMFLAHGRAWDPKGWFWNPAADCVNRARKLLE